MKKSKLMWMSLSLVLSVIGFVAQSGFASEQIELKPLYGTYQGKHGIFGKKCVVKIQAYRLEGYNFPSVLMQIFSGENADREEFRENFMYYNIQPDSNEQFVHLAMRSRDIYNIDWVLALDEYGQLFKVRASEKLVSIPHGSYSCGDLKKISD